MEGNEIVNDDGKIATIMNRYFTNITKHMNFKANKISHQEELVNILDTFKNHKNVQRINVANFHSYSTLNFSKVTESEVRKEILNFFTKKATKNGDIPAKLCIESGIFPDDLKLADVSPIFKKEGTLKS